MISSMLAMATIKPSTIWPLSLAFLSSNFVLFKTTSFLCFKNSWRISFRLSTLGWPSTKTVKFIPNDCSSWVCAKRLFSKTSTDSPFFTSITILSPSLSLSSLISLIPSIFFSLTSSAIFSRVLALFTMKGIS